MLVASQILILDTLQEQIHEINFVSIWNITLNFKLQESAFLQGGIEILR